MNKEIMTYLSQDSRVLLAYLFGSRAQGHSGEMSDYDIGVLMEGAVPYEFKYQLANTLAQFLDSGAVDIVILNDASIELAYNIIFSGKLIFQRSTFYRVEFESATMSKYFDYLPILRRQREEILEESNYESGIQRRRETFRKTERVLAQLRATQRRRT